MIRLDISNNTYKIRLSELPNKIKKTLDISYNHIMDKHIDEIIDMLKIFHQIGTLPYYYRSKSGLVVNNTTIGICEDASIEHLHGMVENISMYVEKQFIKIIATMLIGSYSATCILSRRSLQLSCLAFQAISNKKFFTNKPNHDGKGMGIFEFQYLLESISNSNNKRYGITIFNITDMPLHLIRDGNVCGRPAIHNLYSKLSKYAHNNYLEMSNLIDYESKILPKYSSPQFHQCWKYVCTTNKIISQLLILCAWNDLNHHSKSDAYDYLSNNLKLITTIFGRKNNHTITTLIENLLVKYDKNDVAVLRKKTKILNEKILCNDADNPDYCQECFNYMYGDTTCQSCEQIQFSEKCDNKWLNLQLYRGS